MGGSESMTESGTIIIGTLIVLLIVVVLALILGRNVVQKLRLPGVQWEFRTQDGNAEKGSKDSSDTRKSTIKSPDEAGSSVDFGKRNEFSGTMGNVAGRDIQEGKGTPYEEATGQTSHVDFGTGNTFGGQMGDVAGRDVNKSEDN
jgi:hypothetical protein